MKTMTDAKCTLNRRVAWAAALVLATAMLTALAAPALATVCITCEQDENGSTPTGPAGPYPPKPPMLAIQYGTCFTLLGIDPQSLVPEITAAIRQGFAEMRAALGVKDTYLAEANRTDRPPFLHLALWPSPDVRVHCPSANAQNITVWFKWPGYYGPGDTDAARQAATENLQVRGAYSLGIRVHDGAIKAFVEIARDFARREVSSAVQGTPLAGEVHVTNFTIGYDNVRKRITTRVNGFVEGQITSETTDFWTTFTEDLSINSDGRSLSCRGTTTFNYDGGMDVVFWDVFNFAFNWLVAALNNGRRIDIDEMAGGAVANTDGPACQIAPLFPRQYIVPLPLKLVFNYQALSVNDGVTVYGYAQLVPRQPGAAISGPNPLYVDPYDRPAATYSVRPIDMRGPLTITWEAPGALIMSPHAGTTPVTWQFYADPAVDVYSRALKVTVTDVDGYTASRQTNVWIRSTADQDEPDPDAPDEQVCAQKPWLCE